MVVNALIPTQIGQMCSEPAAGLFAIAPDNRVAERKKDFGPVFRMLRHVGHVPYTARTDIRIKNNTLIANDGNRNYELIHGFSGLAQDELVRDARQALGMSARTPSEMTGKIAGSDIPTPHPTLTCVELDQRAEANNAWTAKPLHLHDMRGADLSYRDLSASSLPMDLTGVDLRFTVLAGVAFGQPSAYQKDLQKPQDALETRPVNESVFNAYRYFAMANYAPYPDLTGVTLADAKISMRCESLPREARAASLDRQFNHLNNPGTGSILASIHTIGDENVKREAMEETLVGLFNAYTAEDRVAIHGSLSDILFNRSYLDARIPPDQNNTVRTLVREVVETNFRTGSERPLTLDVWPNIDAKVFLGAHLEHALALTGEAGMDDNQASFCQQLLRRCVQEADTDLRQLALSLQQTIASKLL